jgi:hypothetical protein
MREVVVFLTFCAKIFYPQSIAFFVYVGALAATFEDT